MTNSSKNNEPKYHSMLKTELARAAGVSNSTFRRWLRTDKIQLEARGCTGNEKLLNPAAVKYLCEKYVIDIL